MRNSLVVGLASAALGFGALVSAAAGQCVPQWDASFVVNPSNGVQALAVMSQWTAPALYVGGKFEQLNGQALSLAASFSEGIWSPLGNGIPTFFNSHGFTGCCAHVRAFAPTNDLIIPGVFVAGEFIQIDNVLFESVGRYQMGAWSPMAGGVSISGCADCQFRVHSLVWFQGALHAAGGFDTAGGVAASNIARWTGSAWEPLGDGVGAPTTDPFAPAWVEALAVFEEGGTERLFAAGAFGRAGTIDTRCIARWDGQVWSAVGGGVNYDPLGPVPTAAAMAVYDDGRGPALYLGGQFNEVGGGEARNLARWDGAQWSGVGGGAGPGPNDMLRALAVFDDGRGPALYAGGQFQTAGIQNAASIARWDGASWEALGAGVDGEVHALASFAHGTERYLYVGGFFPTAGGMPIANLARWSGCAPTCYANCDGSTQTPALNVADFTCFLQRFAAGESYANCDESTTAPVLNVADFTCFLQSFAAGCP